MSEFAARPPQYARLAGELLSSIRAGRYPKGALLPTEMELCRHFGVSRITVRAALRELEVRGIVSRRPGIGTRVESSSSRERFVHTSDSVEDFLQSLANLTFRRLGEQSIVATPAIAEEFGCAAGQPLLRVEALRVDKRGLPVCYSVHHVSAAHAEAIEKMNGRTGSLATRVARHAGEEVAETRQTIDAHNLGAREARLLQARPRDAALLTRRWYLSSTGRVLVYAQSLFPKGRYSYSMRMRREHASL